MFLQEKKRPNYQRHISTRASGFDHLVCQTCCKFEREIAEKKTSFDHSTEDGERAEAEHKLKYAQRMLEEHRARATRSRNMYYQRRSKAASAQYCKKGYLSLIIDGAGAAASNYCPRYCTSEKGEPARHDMLKIKSTYVKVILILTL